MAAGVLQVSVDGKVCLVPGVGTKMTISCAFVSVELPWALMTAMAVLVG